MASLAKTTKAKRAITAENRRKRRVIRSKKKLNKLRNEGYLVSPKELDSLLN